MKCQALFSLKNNNKKIDYNFAWPFKALLYEACKKIMFCLFQIVIPFFSLFVKDIYFLNEGCANKSESGSINFEVSVLFTLSFKVLVAAADDIPVLNLFVRRTGLIFHTTPLSSVMWQIIHIKC